MFQGKLELEAQQSCPCQVERMFSLRRTRYQFGSIERKKRKKGADVWVLRYYVRGANGVASYVSRRLGTVKEIRTKAQAERAAEAIRMEANPGQPGAVAVTCRMRSVRQISKVVRMALRPALSAIAESGTSEKAPPLNAPLSSLA